MDAKDSAPAAAAATGSKDGAAGGEGRAADAEGLAKEASLLFQGRRFAECAEILNKLLLVKQNDAKGRRFAECAEILNKLLLVKQNDAKVLHNIAVAEYFRDGCSDPKKLLDMLNKVKEQSEALACASAEQIETEANLGNSAVSGPKVNNAASDQLASFGGGGVVYAEEFDTSVVLLNIAIVLYHLHEFAHASSVLKLLYQNIEPIDEATALHACLLLLDVSLACQDVARAMDVIQYLEKSFGVGQVLNQGDGNTVQHHSNHQGSKVPGANNASAPDASGSDSSGTNVPESSLAITLSDETLEYETLYSSLDNGSRNLGKPVSNDSSKLLADQTASAVDLKLNLHLYKVRLLLLTRNLKAAKREIKLAMNVARFGDSSSALLLKSQLEYARGNHRKAIKLLMTSSNRTETGMLSMFNNNMGCIYHQLGKHHLSNLFFSKALKNSTSLCFEKPLKLSTFSQDRSHVIAYNCGLQNLVCGNPLAAARCFNKARLIFCDRPIIWLRFAECCLSALERGLLRPIGSSSRGAEEVKVHVVGSGRWRHLVIEDINSALGHQDCFGEDGLVTSDGQYRLSLPFARRCLLNALHLLTHLGVTQSTPVPEKDDDSSQAISSGANNLTNKNVLTVDAKSYSTISSSAPSNSNGDSKESKDTHSSLSAYNDICKREKNMIKQAVLGALAYVELNLGNSVRALSAAKELEQLPDCSRIYLFLSHMYAAEALCLLNRPKEALEHLSFYISDKNEVQFPYTEDDREKWRMDKVVDCDEPNGPSTIKVSVESTQNMLSLKSEEARGVLYANLATMYAIQGNHEQASQLVKEAMSALPDNPRVTLTAIYVDLLLGRSHDALLKLRQCRRVRFLPCAVSSNSS